MEDYREKTLQLLDRTLSLRGIPATRGGVPVDYTARRQALASILAVVLVLLVLASLPARQPTAAPTDGPAAHTEPAGPVLMPATSPSFGLAPGPRDLTATPAAPGPNSTQPNAFLGIGSSPPARFAGPAPGTVPPAAPIWMDGPWRFNPALRNRR